MFATTFILLQLKLSASLEAVRHSLPIPFLQMTALLPSSLAAATILGAAAKRAQLQAQTQRLIRLSEVRGAELAIMNSIPEVLASGQKMQLPMAQSATGCMRFFPRYSSISVSTMYERD